MSAPIPLPTAPGAEKRAPLPDPPRIALVGAFAFPHVQGSQVYFAEQARALRDAGAQTLLVSYAPSESAARPIEDLVHVALSRRLSPRSTRPGPNIAKPLADTALVGELVRSHRKNPFDLVLAHNVEAALVAAAARPWTRAPVVYVAHTLMQHELNSYAPSAAAPPLAALGQALDRAAARAADRVLVLCDAARDALAEHCKGPTLCVPPGLSPSESPSTAEQERLCKRLGLQPGCFALYTGNLDGYQELDRLAQAARHLHVPVVVATHDAERARRTERALRPLRLVTLPDPDDTRTLSFAAGALCSTRRRVGGFPIKLLNYMEAGRPIVAQREVAETLRHERSALLLDRDSTPADFARAIARVLADAALAARLGRGARRVLEAQHRWPTLADRTLAFVAGA